MESRRSSTSTAQRLCAAWRRAASACTCALLLISGGALAARNPASPFADLHHTAWRGDDGAPANIVAIAQTPDGFLWLGTGGGLFRFDGVRFEPIDAASGGNSLARSISALQATPSGKLFIGHRFGGVSVLDQGRIEHHESPKGLFNAWSFAVDASGDVWGAFTGGVARLRAGTWQAFELDGESIPFRGVIADPVGRVWVTARTGAFVLPKGATAFVRVGADLPSSAHLARAPDGRVWAADVGRQRLTALPGDGASTDREHRPLPPTADRHWFDANGATWVRTGDGVVRMTGVPARLRAFGISQGLTGAVLCLLEDREGNIWIGTAGGLDRFRSRDVQQVELGSNDGSVGLAAAEGGRVWATTEFGGLFRIGDSVESFGPVGQRSTHVHRDREGVVWIGTRDALWRIDGKSHPTEVPRPDAAELGSGIADVPIHAIAKDRAGVLWVSIVTRGAYRRLGDRWVRVPDTLGARIMSMGNDSDGRLWIGYIERGAARIDGDEVRSFTPENGLSIGPVISIFGRGPRVWLGGQHGVALFDGKTMKTLLFAGLGKLSVVSGIVETASGQLWINAASGLTVIDALEWHQALADPGHRVRYRHFDAHDGLYGAATVIRPVPSLVDAGDGRLWATTSVGLFVVEPDHLRHNALAPPVIVKSLFAGQRRYEPGRGRLEEAAKTDLRIEYTATSLTIPLRVRFRYKLVGYDKDWQDAGSRREAVYTQVGPGDYVFRVIAANNDGVWNEEGASMAFTVPPAFWQTRWFAALGVALAGVALWGIYRLRIRQVSAQVRGRMAARLQERERIARELHDTLIQGVTGLTLHVRAAANQAPEGSALRGRLERALVRANEVIVEGRDRVSELRVPDQLRAALAAELAHMCRELAEVYPGPACAVVVIGDEREINALVAEEAHRIAREALTNALQHADSHRVDATLRFDSDALKLTVSDDGKGFEAASSAVSPPPGHFGLAGMHERARRVGGQLHVRTTPRGTEVELIVPAASAYRRRSR